MSVVLCFCGLLLLSNVYENRQFCSLNELQKNSELRVNDKNQLYLLEDGGTASCRATMPIAYYPFFFLPLPVNTAEKELLMTVKGIGEVLAEAIITHRTQVGPILEASHLLEVPGVGEKRAISLAAELSFDTAK